jgi:2-polyprenyl-6-methoxyphenol hydroxylase-like FAD-dependent oxidoreductase
LRLGPTACRRRFATDGREETAQSDWLAGCDGAHSVVRHTLAAPFSGETMGSDWVLADTHMSGYPFPDTEVAVYWAPAGVLPIFPIAPGRYRIIANIPPSGGDHPRDPTLEEVAAIVEQRGPKGEPVRSDLVVRLQNQCAQGRKLSLGARFP